MESSSQQASLLLCPGLGSASLAQAPSVPSSPGASWVGVCVQGVLGEKWPSPVFQGQFHRILECGAGPKFSFPHEQGLGCSAYSSLVPELCWNPRAATGTGQPHAGQAPGILVRKGLRAGWSRVPVSGRCPLCL